MFCSTCKRIEIEFSEQKRKICDNGHILCSICDKELDECQICGAKIRNLINIEMDDKIPRLLISSIEDENSDGEKNPENLSEIHQNRPADSIKELKQQLEKFDIPCEPNQDESSDFPTIGCFQVVSRIKPSHPISYTISLEGDEEEIIMNNFRVANKSSHNEEKKEDQKVSQVHLKQPEAFPSCGEGDGNSLLVQRAFSPSNFTRTHSPSYSTRSDCAPSDAEISFIESALQVFHNGRPSICSLTNSHFQALNPSRTELSPPHKIPKIPTIGHRVKLTKINNNDDRIAPQMEPLGLYSDSDDESENDAKISLSRMPVNCPISTCGASSLPSDFFNHMTSDHPYINIVKMSIFKLANFTVCPAGNLLMCHRMFLIEGKLNNIGHGFSEHCLPILIVSMKLNLGQLFGSTLKPPNLSEDVFCIWPLSVYEYPVKYSLNVFAHGENNSLVRCISSTVPYLSSNQTFREIFNNSLVLNRPTLEKLTSNDSLISCQIVFH